MHFQSLPIKRILGSSIFIIIAAALVKLVIHLATGSNYGYFIDELYTIACGEHLSFGYVDMPPFAPFLSRISGLIFGYSLFSIHIFPAVSGALLIVFAGLFTMELGGQRFAVLLTCIAVLTSVVWLIFNSMFAYDNFDQLFTLIFLFMLMKLIKTDNPRLFINLGIIGGICLLTKLTLVFIVIAIIPALLLTKSRKYFAAKWLWIALLIAAVMAAPYVLWQYFHQWPLVEYLQEYSKYGTYHANPLEYIMMITLMINPISLPLWLLGFYYYFFVKEGKAYKIFGFIPVFLFFVLFIVMKAKAYMILVTFIPLIAAGSVLLGKSLENRNWLWLRTLSIILLLVQGCLLLPIGVPLLKPDNLAEYYSFFNRFTNKVKTDNSKTSIFPQTTADRFGWDELVKNVADVYNSLPLEERKKCTIFGGNYGAAGAVDLLGGKYGLPKAISGHLTYYIWGPGTNTGEILISVGVPLKRLAGFYDEVTEVRKLYNKYTMPRNNVPVYLCRKPKMTIQEAWKFTKSY